MAPKVTQAQRDAEAFAVNCKWLEPCVSCKIKTKIQCLRCGRKWRILPSGVKGGRGCEKCRYSSRKISQEQRDQEAAAVNCKWLEKCEKSGDRKKIKCLDCGHKRRVRPSDVKSGAGCPKCAYRRKSVQKRLNFNIAKKELEWTEKYINNYTKIGIKCLICSYEWKVKPNDIQQGSGCPSCSKTGFDPNRPATLYLLIDNRNVAKIGITRTGTRRITNHKLRGWELDECWQFETGDKAYQIEQKVIKWWRNDLNLPAAYEKIPGWTETVDANKISLEEIKKYINSLNSY